MSTDTMYKAVINDNPQIYVANLGAYNDGRLVGKWLDLTTFKDVEELKEAVDKVANSLGSIYGDEWAIHDYLNFPDMGENPDLEQVFEVVEWIELKGFNVINAFLTLYSVDDLGYFEDSYRGHWPSFKDYAEELFYDCYEVPKHLENYIDIDKFAYDLSLDDTEVDDPNGGVFVFGGF